MSFGTRKTFIEVDYRDVDKLAKAVYGFNPEIVASEEWNNDESHDMTVDGKLDEWEEKTLAHFKADGTAGFGITRILLNDLARNGHIEAGDYLIEVYW